MQKQAILAAVVYPMVNAVLFGFGAIAVPAFFAKAATTLLPIVIVASIILALPISWFIAPRMSLALSGKRRVRSD
ncbi:MAG: hypothetical protein ACYC0C_09180 [Devosia sp.]